MSHRQRRAGSLDTPAGNIQGDASGRPRAADGTVEDITDLKRVEQALNAMRRQREELASHVPGMFYQYRLRPDGSSHFPLCQREDTGNIRVAPEDVVEDATPAFAALHPEDRDRVHETIRASGQSLALWHDEYRVQFPDGRVIWVEGEASPEAMPDGSILWHGYIHDVTSRRISAEELRLAAKVLSTQERASRYRRSRPHSQRQLGVFRDHWLCAGGSNGSDTSSARVRSL